MARIRSVKPEFWGDRKLARLVTRDARLLYIALWNQADEHSRVQGDPRYVKGHCLPYDDDLDEAAVDALVDDLATAGRVVRYDVDGDPYLFLPKLAKHQRLEANKVPSRLPEPPDPSVESTRLVLDADLSASRADLPAPIVVQQVAGSMGQVAGCMEPVANRADKPAPHGTRIPEPFPISDEMKAWVTAEGITPAQARASTVRFVDYWRGKPGKDGRKTDWPATWRNWLRRDYENVPRASTTDQRVAEALAVRDRYAKAEQKAITA